MVVVHSNKVNGKEKPKSEKFNSDVRQKRKRSKKKKKRKEVIPLPEKKSHDIVYKNRHKNVISCRSPVAVCGP